MIDSGDQIPSLTKTIEIDQLTSEPLHVSLIASDDDKPALAQRFDVPRVDRLRGDLEVIKSGDVIRVTGRIAAGLGRTCVVSLEPMDETIDEEFEVLFTVERPQEAGGDEVAMDLDAPEPIDGDRLDLGEVVLEQLVLAMSPHPRREGAEPPEDPGRGEGSSPFDVLKSLKGEG